ncbi:flavodoxin family protein [Peloplasma aerotolerans]|jgi:flavodoxin|uniref:Flavodoxin domain-containing protein n=1 Tax=Peloplasma aerotolerans TaxID=3044389 RepID=A0AAW6U820_9MOLU|nr:flavodoxin domain-containing protein [Mariniplasma sp. M4Ah]MDI6453085.1 flavodoxin domain-containing protein [Mariniplasma sp. M4Ah]
MKKCIIIYSKTGNTRSVANRLNEVLSCDFFEVKATSDNPSIQNVELTEVPQVGDYDHLVFASPVHGFSLSHVMNTYLNQLPDLSEKTVDLFITHHFPFAWMGGNRTLKQMKKIIENKNGTVRYTTSVNWSSKKRESDISNMIHTYHS